MKSDNSLRATSLRATSVRSMIARLWRDDAGGEVIEYALVLGLIIVAAIAVIGAVGTKVLARWTSVNSSM